MDTSRIRCMCFEHLLQRSYNRRFWNLQLLLQLQHLQLLYQCSVLLMAPSLSPDPEEQVSESVQENFDVEQLREEPECALDNSTTSKKLALALKVNEELQEATLAAQAECSKLQSDLAMAQFSSELEQELHSVRGQLASEQSRSFCLEVDVAELRQKLQCMEILQWELDLLWCQKDASKEAVIQAAQKQGTGVWSWLAGSPPDSDDVEDRSNYSLTYTYMCICVWCMRIIEFQALQQHDPHVTDHKCSLFKTGSTQSI